MRKSPFRLLFCLKQRSTYWGCDETYSYISSGLGNSARFAVDMLNANGVPASLVELADNNQIYKAINAFRPTHVILEALWVVPSKIDELRKLYPRIQWIVRLHSNIPFLSQEGIAAEWLAGYLARDVEVMCNSKLAVADVRQTALDYGKPQALVTYGPNYYPTVPLTKPRRAYPGQVHIGCFGAVRTLKNQLSQAIAAVSFANQNGLALSFHINSTRQEGQAAPIVKNIQQLFLASVGTTHTLVEEPWMSWVDFKKKLSTTIDISMQVAFDETFNIVSADAVACGVPIVVSPTIEWASPAFQANPNDIRCMTERLEEAYPVTALRIGQQVADLDAWSVKAKHVWLRRFG